MQHKGLPCLLAALTLFFVVLGISNVSLVVRQFSASVSASEDSSASEDPSAKHPWALRLDWTSLRPISHLAQRISAVQTQCSSEKTETFHHLNAGIGSNLHTWTQALCAAMERDAAIVTEGPWPWVDEDSCPLANGDRFPMLCYFGHGHLPEGRCDEYANTTDTSTGNHSANDEHRQKYKFEACP